MQRISDLNKKINILSPAKVSDGMGGTTTSTVTIVSNLPAAIWPVSAKEMVNNQANPMIITHRIRIRYRSVMKSNWILQYGNRKFNVVSVIDPSEAHEWLDIMVKEAA